MVVQLVLENDLLSSYVIRHARTSRNLQNEAITMVFSSTVSSPCVPLSQFGAFHGSRFTKPSIRISWCRQVIRQELAEEEPVYMDRSCKFHQSTSRMTTVMNVHCFVSEDEIHPELRFTGAGILAMANSGPNTNGTFPDYHR